MADNTEQDALCRALRTALHRTRVAFDDYHGFTETKARGLEWCAHCHIVAQKTIERMNDPAGWGPGF